MIEKIEIMVEAIPVDPYGMPVTHGHMAVEARVKGADNLTIVNKLNEIIDAVNELHEKIRPKHGHSISDPSHKP